MKKFYSFLLTIGAFIQSLFFWVLIYDYATNKQIDSTGRVGFFIFLIVGLFILSLIGKFVRGLKGFWVIFLDMLLSPIRFIAQLIVGILCLANKVKVERGEYDEHSKFETFMFTLCTHSGPATKSRSHYVPTSSSSSSSSSHSSSRPSYGSSYGNNTSSTSLYTRSEVYSMMRTIANTSKDDVRGEGNAQCVLTTSVSFSGTHIYFKINTKLYNTNHFSSQYELDEFKSNVEYAMQELASSIRDDVKSWFDSIETEENYTCHFN